MRLFEFGLTVSLFFALFHFGFEMVFLVAFIFIMPLISPFGRWEFPAPTLTYFIFRYFRFTECSSCNHSIFNDFPENGYQGNDFSFSPNMFCANCGNDNDRP